MEEEGVGLVLARAIDLRLKIRDCVHNKATAAAPITSGSVDDESLRKRESGSQRSETLASETEQDEDEADKLINICDALESLESQLFILQELQQQQKYEKEAALSEIEQSRKILLDKLKDYKGEDLEVINEASTFAGETVHQNQGLLLPPYPTYPPHSLHFPSARKLIRNAPPREPKKKEIDESMTNNELQTGPKKPRNGLRSLIGSMAKTALTLIGVVSVLSMSGYGPVRKISVNKALAIQQPICEEKKVQTNKCPPGKTLVLQDGEARCIVKERVEVPFSSAFHKPDVNYGCG